MCLAAVARAAARALGMGLAVAVGLGAAVPSPRAADEPALAAVWRQLLARPTAPPPQPAENPASPAKIALGERLFSDPRLSGQGARACISCHEPERAFSDGRPRAVAVDGRELLRNVPGLFDLAWAKSFMWDGRAATLEAQAEMPILDPQEMGGSWPTIEAALAADPGTSQPFADAFAERPAVTADTVRKALAAYVRSLRSPPTRFDRWVDGDDDALAAQERAGLRLFVGKAGCVGCHAGWRFTDDRFHDIGLPGPDPGRGAVAGGIAGLAAFKTPTLRELTRTAPYMHDGSLPTLEAVVGHYAGGLVRRPSLSANLVRDLELSSSERAALVAFLKTLSSLP